MIIHYHSLFILKLQPSCRKTTISQISSCIGNALPTCIHALPRIIHFYLLLYIEVAHVYMVYAVTRHSNKYILTREQQRQRHREQQANMFQENGVVQLVFNVGFIPVVLVIRTVRSLCPYCTSTFVQL